MVLQVLIHSVLLILQLQSHMQKRMLYHLDHLHQLSHAFQYQEHLSSLLQLQNFLYQLEELLQDYHN